MLRDFLGRSALGIAPSKSADQQRQPILEKIKNHGQQSPRVQRHIKGFARIWPMQQPRKKNEVRGAALARSGRDRKSTRLNSSHQIISYAVFCLKKKKNTTQQERRLQNHRT